jgi:hypothetical protein
MSCAFDNAPKEEKLLNVLQTRLQMNNCTFDTSRLIITDARWINHIIGYGYLSLIFPFLSVLVKAFAFLKSNRILHEYLLRL